MTHWRESWCWWLEINIFNVRDIYSSCWTKTNKPTDMFFPFYNNTSCTICFPYHPFLSPPLYVPCSVCVGVALNTAAPTWRLFDCTPGCHPSSHSVKVSFHSSPGYDVNLSGRSVPSRVCLRYAKQWYSALVFLMFPLLCTLCSQPTSPWASSCLPQLRIQSEPGQDSRPSPAGVWVQISPYTLTKCLSYFHETDYWTHFSADFCIWGQIVTNFNGGGGISSSTHIGYHNSITVLERMLNPNLLCLRPICSKRVRVKSERKSPQSLVNSQM